MCSISHLLQNFDILSQTRFICVQLQDLFSQRRMVIAKFCNHLRTGNLFASQISHILCISISDLQPANAFEDNGCQKFLLGSRIIAIDMTGGHNLTLPSPPRYLINANACAINTIWKIKMFAFKR